MYLANKIHKDLKTHFSPEEIIGEELTCIQVSRMMNKILKPLGARLKIVRDDELKCKNGSKKEYYSFSGYYDSEKKKTPIMIHLHITPSKKTFKFTKNRYKTFTFMFSQVVQHEFIHKSQEEFRPEQFDRLIRTHYSDKIQKKRKQTIEYLSTWCEVEAYAHDIAMEIHHYYKNEKPEKIIKHIDKQKCLDSYLVYKDAFKGLDWDRLKKSLLRKIWRWLPSAQIPKLV